MFRTRAILLTVAVVSLLALCSFSLPVCVTRPLPVSIAEFIKWPGANSIEQDDPDERYRRPQRKNTDDADRRPNIPSMKTITVYR